MPISALSFLATMLAAAAPGAATLAELRWQRRVVLASAPVAGDAELEAQRRVFAAMRAAADDRDLVLIEIIGDRVAGAGDSAASLRQRFTLPQDRFGVLLIGKDGGEKRRADKPFSAAELVATIDAMPMRRSGTR